MIKILPILSLITFVIGTTSPSICRRNETFLDCRNAGLKDIPYILEVPDTVTHLDFSFNKIRVVYPFNLPRPSSVIEVYLAHNNIDTIVRGAFDDMTRLEVLDLSYNQINGSSLHIETYKYEIGHFENIKRLILKGNHLGKLERLTFTAFGFSTLEYLDLSSCSLETLEHLSIDNLAILKHLNLSFNHLSKFEALSLEGLSELEVLDLSHNELSILNEMSRLVSLKTLYLDSNKLEAIKENIFKPLFNLEILSLKGNMFRTLYPYLLPLDSHKMKEIRLDENPWHCDCRMRWLVEDQTDEIVFRDFKLKCEFPSRYRGKNVFDIRSKDLNCFADYSRLILLLTLFIIVCFMLVGIVWFIRANRKYLKHLRCCDKKGGEYAAVYHHEDPDGNGDSKDEQVNIIITTTEDDSLLNNEETTATEDVKLQYSDD
ncbi:chondroadherin-like [Mytilus trossulus]|uniref:chondroadherin-like n=1 Tax=Mytilus trossulus TaxID=6551 RepID=UPI0030067695